MKPMSIKTYIVCFDKVVIHVYVEVSTFTYTIATSYKSYCSSNHYAIYVHNIYCALLVVKWFRSYCNKINSLLETLIENDINGPCFVII